MRRMRRTAIFAAAAVIGLTLHPPTTPAAQESSPADDAYLRGYVAAVAEREFGIRPATLDVTAGAVRMTGVPLAPAQRERFAEAIRNVKGVRDVDISPLAAGNDTSPHVPDVKTAAKEVAAVAASPVKAVTATGDDRQLGLLPGGSLFDPLLADPRWPHFSATYRNYVGDDDFKNVGGADFGGTVPVYRLSTPGGGATEFGLQAGVFAIFDLDGDSNDLLNADYFVGITNAYRIGDFSILTRVSHTSSHLGDEFILARPDVDRVNLSYEKLDMIFSYDLNRSWRVYAGPGYMFNVDPEDLEKWTVQYGVEWQSPRTFAGNRLRPIAAADFKHFQQTDWDLSLSVRAGVQIEGAELRGNRLQLMLEYFTGHSPAGQFFLNDYVQWWGLGLHWFF